MNNFIVRTISGAVYVGLIIAAALAGQIWFGLLLTLFAAVAAIEFGSLTGEFSSDGGAVGASISATTVTAAAATVWSMGTALIAVPAIAILFFLTRSVLALYDRRQGAFMAVGHSVLCYAYIGIPLGLMNMLYSISDLTGSPAGTVIMIFLMIWLNDTGAYLVGSRIGRRRLFERLSPKKSWEGFIGGLLFCVLAGVAAGEWLHGPVGQWQWLAVGVLVCVFSTWGDLFESLLKRNLGVKDSGSLIPGHGGILDRIDSLLFVAPAISLFLFLSVYYYIL